jgi:hypothetical protein
VWVCVSVDMRPASEARPAWNIPETWGSDSWRDRR